MQSLESGGAKGLSQIGKGKKGADGADYYLEDDDALMRLLQRI